ncbi:MAG: L-sorbosone dehydrogenase [Candidatus Eremiobacteraeota bacterium]|nr:L-sorbosone dehydrogenase [Candidatus Eremiobacteraeota bacterium]
MGAQPPVQALPPGSLANTTPAPLASTPLSGETATPLPSASPNASPSAAASVTPAPAATPPLADARLHVPQGFVVNVVANVGGARELVALPNGDLLVGTSTAQVKLVPNAESAGAAGAPVTFASLPEGTAHGVAFGGGFVFVATQHHVYRMPYANGAQSGSATQIASVRTGPVAPNSDGDVHTTSSVAVSGTNLYVSVASSCNACVEADPTRATVQRMALDGSGITTQATRMRNAIALATDPASGSVWAGNAGQDALPAGHPYEFFDPVSAHAKPADYGWPDCEENHVAYRSGANCAKTVAPALVFPAYSTPIAAAFSPASQSGAYAFPAAWRGGMFVSMHGSWHQASGVSVVPPHVAFVPFTSAVPARAVSWADPTTQWIDFFTGFQDPSGKRIGRTTGVAVGSQGSLFVADDDTGNIYRIRPAGQSGSAVHRAKSR